MNRILIDYHQRLLPYLIASLPEQGRVLDVGCDDGRLADSLRALRPDLEFHGVDIQDLRPCSIPRTLYDGKRIPLPDDSFDVVLAVDMLHHTRNISELVAEMARVSRGRVVIKDHLADNLWTHCVVSLGDWFMNAPRGIPCEYNFPSEARWRATFDGAGLTLKEFHTNLQLIAGSNTRNNPLFILEK